MKYIYLFIFLLLNLVISPSVSHAAKTPQQSTTVDAALELPIEQGKRKKAKKSRKKLLKKRHKTKKRPQLTGPKLYALEVFMNIFIILCAIGGYTFFLCTMLISSLSVFWMIGIFGFIIIPLLSILFSMLPSGEYMNMAAAIVTSSVLFVFGGGVANLAIGLAIGVPALWIMGAAILGALVLGIIIALIITFSY